jgi:4-hydroxy-tetrahydrodipicolinate synthase
MSKPVVNWEGCFPAPVTPFFSDGRIDDESFIENIRSYVEDDEVSGITTSGHNGEEWALTVDERLHILVLAKNTAEQVRKGTPVIAGIDQVGVNDLIEEGKKARDAGAHGIMITPPFYVAQTTYAEIFTRYERASREVGLPIVLYNNPRRTGLNLNPTTIARLAEIDNVVAVKQAERDFASLSETIRLCGNNAAVFPGPASYILGATIAGAKGYIATGPDLLGRDGAQYYWTIKQGDMEKARHIHHQLTPLYSMLNTIGTWPAAFKAALEMVGKRGGYTRDPVQPLNAAEREKVKQVLVSLNVPLA